MKKVIYILFLCLLSSKGISQVGIGTENPQEALHVAGVDATIRIESLDAVNNSTYNDGINLAPAYVDGNGDITIGNGTGTSGTEPFNFLIEVPNFVPDDPYGIAVGTGTVVNNDDLGTVYVEGLITTVSITVQKDAILEFKYGITTVITGNDLSAGPPYFYATYDQAIAMHTFFKVDINSDGLDATEIGKSYGHKSQYYETNYGGAIGYPYMNSQAYLTVPAGTHEIYFYGAVTDSALHYTSVGFGGAQDYLKIRVYN